MSTKGRNIFVTTISSHLDAVRNHLPQPDTELVTPAEAADRILAEDVLAAQDSPLFDNSQMDGYAIPGAGGEYHVGPTVAAGSDPAPLDNLAAPVMTGAKVPPGTHAIVPVEKCDPSEFLEPGATIRVPETPQGQFIRTRGSDAQQNDLLLPAGLRVTPAGVGLLISQGIERVRVNTRASILIVTGGAEVGTHITDSNSPMLTALAHRHGIGVAGHVLTDDDPVALQEALARGVDKHHPDVIVTSGGISAGKFEVVRQVLDGWFGHVDMQPGGPQGLATFDGVPAVCLPGNPISTLVSFRMFVAPTLGHAPSPVRTVLTEEREGLPGKEQLLRGTLTTEGVTPAGGTSSHLLAQGAVADCLIRIPAGATVGAGEFVTVYPL